MFLTCLNMSLVFDMKGLLFLSEKVVLLYARNVVSSCLTTSWVKRAVIQDKMIQDTKSRIIVLGQVELSAETCPKGWVALNGAGKQILINLPHQSVAIMMESFNHRRYATTNWFGKELQADGLLSAENIRIRCAMLVNTILITRDQRR